VTSVDDAGEQNGEVFCFQVGEMRAGEFYTAELFIGVHLNLNI
jgi:hypothetical protein